MAERYVIDGDAESARKTLWWLLWFEPANPEALLLLGLSLHVEGELQSAIDTFDRIPEQAAAGKAESVTVIPDQLLAVVTRGWHFPAFQSPVPDKNKILLYQEEDPPQCGYLICIHPQSPRLSFARSSVQPRGGDTSLPVLKGTGSG